MVFVNSFGKSYIMIISSVLVEILVKRVVNCVLRKCDGFKRVKMDLNGMEFEKLI